jgi:16S rRNA (guanine966-N2)-methyltransferase
MRPNRKISAFPRPAGDDEEPSQRRSVKKTPPRIAPTALRIIGGELRRRTVVYHGDRSTRPMKDSVRENLFNILGKAVEGATAWDLFAGTGIVALEAISRGAVHALAMDSSRECVRWMREAATTLGVSARLEVLQGDSFRLAPARFKYATDERRVVFCCPPYAMWESHVKPLRELLLLACQGASAGSFLVIESEKKFDLTHLFAGEWDVRTYGNTNLAFVECATVSDANPA